MEDAGLTHGHGLLYEHTAERLRVALRDHGFTAANRGRVVFYVLIESNGGDANAVYSMINTLRHYAERIEVFVPRRAKSAACLFALGADYVWMDGDAELGPLDAQYWSRSEQRWVSALARTSAVAHMSAQAYTAAAGFDRVAKRWNADRDSAMMHHVQLIAKLHQILVNKLDANEMIEASRAMTTVQWYAERLMAEFGVVDAKVKRKLNELTSTYPSHRFVIAFDEAAELLPDRVCLADGHGRWSEIVERYGKLHTYSRNAMVLEPF